MVFSLFKKTFDYDRYAKVLPARSLFDDPAVFYHHLDTKRTELSFLELALNEGVKSFINYLSQAHLITVLENYSPNAVKVVRKNKKYIELFNNFSY